VGETRLLVRVRPRAGAEGVEALPDGSVRVRVRAAPVDGAANQAVRQLLAHALGCPPAGVEIVRGQTARVKLVRIAGLTADQARRRLSRGA
jgi:uncharacterized protein YggU (UPF0235/DUF167 family)